MDKRRLKPGKQLKVWIRGGRSLESNWKIEFGYGEAGACKGTGRSTVDKRKLTSGEEMEEQVWIREGWSLERN